MPARWIHHPWDAPPETLAAARVSLGVDYPRPIIEHAEARKRALAVYGSIRDVGRSCDPP